MMSRFSSSISCARETEAVKLCLRFIWRQFSGLDVFIVDWRRRHFALSAAILFCTLPGKLNLTPAPMAISKCKAKTLRISSNIQKCRHARIFKYHKARNGASPRNTTNQQTENCKYVEKIQLEDFNYPSLSLNMLIIRKTYVMPEQRKL